MDGRSISKEMAMQIADRELGPSMRERKLLECLAAADRLAEAVNGVPAFSGPEWSWGYMVSEYRASRIRAALSAYEATRKGEEG